MHRVTRWILRARRNNYDRVNKPGAIQHDGRTSVLARYYYSITTAVDFLSDFQRKRLGARVDPTSIRRYKRENTVVRVCDLIAGSVFLFVDFF